MPRAQTPAKERAAQRARLVGRASKEQGTAVSVKEAGEIASRKNAGVIQRGTPADIREFIVHGITEYLTHDRVLDFQSDECRFVGDIIVEVSDMKLHRGGTLVLNVQTTDDFVETLIDAARLSRAHPLFCRLFELFPKPASPWADGTHPDDPEPATPGQPHLAFQREWETDE